MKIPIANYLLTNKLSDFSNGTANNRKSQVRVKFDSWS